MRWTMFILNVLVAVAFQFIAAFATSAHRTHAFSTYRELVINHALVEKPTYTSGEPLDVEGSLRKIGSGGYYSTLAHIGSAACILNGISFFLFPARKRVCTTTRLN